MVCSRAPNNAVLQEPLNIAIWDMLILSDRGDQEYFTSGQCAHSCVAWQAGGMELLATWSHAMEMNTFVGVILVVRINLNPETNLFDLTNN